MPQAFQDAQAALPFVVAQGRNIEAAIYEARYPEYSYRDLMPVVTEGNQWAVGTQFYSQELAGEAKFLSGAGNDMPFNQVSFGEGSHDFAMIGSGWEWNLEEVNTAALYGRNLNDLKAMSASRSTERLLYDIAVTGSAEKNWRGFTNQTNVQTIIAAATGTGSSTLFADKTPLQVLSDLNNLLKLVPQASNNVELADTISLPLEVMDYISTTFVGTEANSPTILERFITSNVYTARTKRPLTILTADAQSTAGGDGGGRIVAYRKAIDVIRFHLPMPRMVLPVHQKSIMGFETGIIARTGGVEVRLPGAMAYMDGVSEPA
ncbi:DUF2184 domain-containing protein [Pseudomonas prosekii]|uniref:DUF2184 domain-containing protein n=1 Tax=Pseudomonas prosekii TaxID=1148509 RepID=A0A1H2B369_9PSED|nr:DUF2184 domain-containing protein [Pseudomonas prosekii]SDT52651.1 hypothetical protein SAMN05216222_4890 [Pseudomonas prosekii]